MNQVLAVSCLCLATAALGADEPAKLTKTTHIYKHAGTLPVQADVYRFDDTQMRPVVVWIHGGALVSGNRNSVPKNLLDLCRAEGYALVSLDYRLAPEVKLPEIIADIEDAFRWLREKGPTLLHIDPDRLAVTGGSAGGYLTLMAGLRVQPRPRALVAYWGYGDVDGDWYTKPSEHYRKQPLVSEAEARKGVGGAVITGSEPGIDMRARGRFYLYLRQNGLWTKEVTGFDPQTERAKLDPFCPVRNVTPEYPPTMLVHGTEDTDVPYELSAAMAKEFERHKVPHELVTVPGAGHGLAGGDRKLIDEAHAKALAFVRTNSTRSRCVMSGKMLKDKLIKGDRVYGTFFQHAVVPALVDFLPPGVLDFVIVSAEHNALDIADFLPMRYALNAKGIACLARTHSRDPDDVSKVCDSFDGVVVPYVEDVAHAKALAAAAVYRPAEGEGAPAACSTRTSGPARRRRSTSRRCGAPTRSSSR